MFGLGFQEVLVILLVALLLFGASRLPEIGKALGKSISEFKKAFHGDDKNQGDKNDEGTKS
ncbi:MAG: twin-arginine translocase TatA/TatE family subunit [Endomicrobiales bacterium]|nr:twin-arginine translocase TatA/TatE family subunit [Endomicrobiales bacterium]